MRGSLCSRLQTLPVGIGRSAPARRQWLFRANTRRRTTTSASCCTSECMVEALAAIEGHPWAEFGRAGKSITKNQLARLLRPYKIKPGTIRTGSGAKDTAKGYKVAQFEDAFERYLFALNQTVTPSQANESAVFPASQTVTSSFDVTDQNVRKSNVSADCDGVTVRQSSSEEPGDADLPAGEEVVL